MDGDSVHVRCVSSVKVPGIEEVWAVGVEGGLTAGHGGLGLLLF